MLAARDLPAGADRPRAEEGSAHLAAKAAPIDRPYSN
jgi:hypothetical protein